jgi:peroxiredoxin
LPAPGAVAALFGVMKGHQSQSQRNIAGLCVFVGVALVGGACAPPEKAADPPPTGGLVGNPAPDFHVDAIAGRKGKVSLADLRGNVVLIDFWGTFCGPCKKSFPKLEELEETYGGRGLRIVGISEDEDEDKDKIPAFAATYGAKFPLAWDAEKNVAKLYKPETMPSSFLVDKKGVVRFAHVGYHDGEEQAIAREIAGLLAA